MTRFKIGLLRNILWLAVASYFLGQPASAQMTGDRCKDGIYGYCFRNWQRDGYQSLGHCYDINVAVSCPESASRLRNDSVFIIPRPAGIA